MNYERPIYRYKPKIKTFNISPNALTCKKGSNCNVSLSNYYIKNVCPFDTFERKTGRGSDDDSFNWRTIAFGLLLALALALSYKLVESIFEYFNPEESVSQSQSSSRSQSRNSSRRQSQSSEPPSSPIESFGGDDLQEFRQNVTPYFQNYVEPEALSQPLGLLMEYDSNDQKSKFEYRFVKDFQRDLFRLLYSSDEFYSQDFDHMVKYFEDLDINMRTSRKKKLVYFVVQDLVNYMTNADREVNNDITRFFIDYYIGRGTPLRSPLSPNLSPVREPEFGQQLQLPEIA
jgi:hypothetical protein